VYPLLFPPALPPGNPLKIDGVARVENALTFAASSGGGIRLKIGDLVRADVLTIMADGSVSIRITKESGESAVVLARSRVPLDQGESVLLKVTEGEEGEVSFRFLGVVDKEGGRGRASGVPMAYRGTASELAAVRMTAGDARQLQQLFRAFPDSVKSVVPGFARLEGSPGMEGLSGAVLKEAVEGSGVLLETKLKGGAGDLVPGADRKEALLHVGRALREMGGSTAVRGSGISPGEAAVKADGMLSTIESYQISSTVHGVLHAPLALAWEELQDGEILFRKRNRGGGESYTCDLNLDLLPLGKMAVSVTMYNGSFFVSLSPEDEGTRSLVASSSDEVGKRFREAGLPLSALSIQRKQSVSFGAPAADGVDVEA
ncbi:MAG: flagellar hook-length control protein FliK, partial [Deltaproteobacteria bacterium]|nr:flagellar hook-length control protein FliK [Deltaproteobacteria bacterium]